MPSNKKPLTTVQSSAGKLHADVATASAHLFPDGDGQEALLLFLNAAIQRQVAYIKQTAVVPATGQTTFDLRAVETGAVWVSDDAGEDIRDLFQVVDENGNPPKILGTASVTVASITGPTIGDGFIANDPLTVNFSSALPTTGSFRIWYGIERRLATIEPDADTALTLRRARRLDPLVLQPLLEDLHADVGKAWTGPWDATIETLAASGLNERYRRATTVPKTAATGLLTATNQPANTEEIQIDGKDYTFQTVLTDVDGNVLIGGSLAATLDNLRGAIRLNGTPGVDYAASTILHPTVSVNDTATTLIATAKFPGVLGNLIGTLSAAANFSWGSATLTGGTGLDFDTAGDGAVIKRDGQAPTVEASVLGFEQYSQFRDDFWAHWKATIASPDTLGAIPAAAKGCGTGFVSVGSTRMTSNFDEKSQQTLSGASHMSVSLRRIVADTLSGVDVRTRIDYTLPCTLNPTAGGTGDARREIDLTGTNFFENGSGNTEIAVGYDMLRVTYTGSLIDQKPEVYVITEILSATRARLRTLSGGFAGFPNGSSVTEATCQLVKAQFHVGGGSATLGAHAFSYPDPVRFGTSIFNAVPPGITDDPNTAGEYVPTPARFLAAAKTESLYSASSAAVPHALEWGGFDPSSGAALDQSFPGKLRGDGGVDATIYSRPSTFVTITVNSTTTWHPGLEGSRLLVAFTLGGDTAWTLELGPNYSPVDGEVIDLFLLAPTGGSVTVTWPAGFNFDTTQLGDLFGLAGNDQWWQATYFAGSGSWQIAPNNYRNLILGANSFTTNTTTFTAASGGGAIVWAPLVDGGYIQIDITDSGAYTVAHSIGSSSWPKEGAIIYIEVLQTAGTGGTITWPGIFTFSGADGTIPAGAGDRILYRGIYSPSGDWLFTRTDY